MPDWRDTDKAAQSVLFISRDVGVQKFLKIVRPKTETKSFSKFPLISEIGMPEYRDLAFCLGIPVGEVGGMWEPGKGNSQQWRIN